MKHNILQFELIASILTSLLNRLQHVGNEK